MPPGRKRKDPDIGLQRSITLSMNEVQISALNELCRLRGESRGAIVGRFVLQALERERRKKS